MLGGSIEVDKSSLVRNIAWSLSEELKVASVVPSNKKVPVLVWYRSSSDPQRIGAKLQETKEASIFILSQISPQDIRYNWAFIQKNAENNKHFVLITTDISFPAWELSDVDKSLFWQELSPEDLYGLNDLANILTQGLNDHILSLPTEFSVDLVAEQLKTPENISKFIRLLCKEKSPLESEKVRELIELVQDQRRTLRIWFNIVLSQREQLLALGLSFFDGLFDDQFFAAIERVIERVWRRRDSSLCALDYCDLDNLRDYFLLSPIEDHGIRIESRIPEQRRLLFLIAWNSHRRYIISALPVVAELVKDSVNKRSFDVELYGNKKKRNQLRTVISDAISDIGVISDSTVQQTLLELAADRELGVQAVAARALAQWRKAGRDKELFNILNEWQLQTWLDLIAEILDQNDGREKDEQGDGPRDYIRATIALTIGYAAIYDPPNKLSNDICDLLKDLAEDQSPMVRNRFCWHTLLYVVPLHAMQLRNILHNMAQYIDLIPAIGRSLALAYQDNAKDVLRILDEWHKECRENHPKRVDPEEITLRCCVE